ncbi:hypothetical protein [Methylomonas fluvii]|uniref:Uncharacterized protein n=1 Tax=Methylomonas fluvii TaxID=1854564 RepID=A0ABR9DIX2_9GAMM|nr:hypothetical protein [Methylomonas fluvii]MBD9363073.1 hypothetical protein [Methylomonas fluvii]CAD6876299.1 hypothetical protein [Methylomonas fluvii]
MLLTLISGNKEYSSWPLRPWVAEAQVAADIINPALFNMSTPFGLCLSKPDVAGPSIGSGRTVLNGRVNSQAFAE